MNLTVNGYTSALNVACGEIREAMSQYTRCADPTESAARKERMRLAEENGETEEAARNMVAAITAFNAPILNAEDIIPINTNMVENQNERAGDNNDNSPARLPALERLGPLPELNLASTSAEPARIPAKKRLGRPPLSKNKPKSLGIKEGSGKTGTVIK
ncbi:unnamed protein product [Eruca vesicaria subsp. sativa]|uniref:Uncharacterized protein n=1 Tax=Eruca vesicaria subsp. sativa TaxID=29727 RepID=A0ABC8M109_ERUVS|nr:unnamed protein product [Eruca vesicaria subsp. sativa]